MIHNDLHAKVRALFSALTGAHITRARRFVCWTRVRQQRYELCYQRSRARTLRVRVDLYAGPGSADGGVASRSTTGAPTPRQSRKSAPQKKASGLRPRTSGPDPEIRSRGPRPEARGPFPGALRGLQRAQERLQVAAFPVGQVDVEAVLVEVDNLADVLGAP